MKKVLINILKKYKFNFLELIILIIIYAITLSLPAKMLGEIIDLLGENIANDLIIKKFAILFFSIVIFCISKTWFNFLGRTCADNIHRDLENAVFEKFLNLKVENIENIKNGELMSYILRYTGEVRRGITGIIKYGIRTVLGFSVAIFFMVSVNFKLTLIVMVAVFIEGFILNKLKQKVKKAESDAQKAYTKMSEFVQESTDSIRTTKVFTGEEIQILKFKKESENVQKKYIKVGVNSAILYATVTMCFGICYGIVALYGTNLIIKGLITVGEFIAFNSYIKDLYYPLTWIPQLLTRIKKMQVGIEKLDEFFNLKRRNFGRF